MPELNGLAPDPSRFDFEALFDTAAGQELPSDGPSDDRTEAALLGRLRGYKRGGDLNWLMEGTESPEDESKQSPDSEDEDSGSSGLLGLASAGAMDLGKGAIEAPRQAVGGMRDAVQSMIDFGSSLDEAYSLGGVTFTDAEGNFW